MSWTREHIEELVELQLRTQRIIASAGTDAPGVDWLVEVNECLTNAQCMAYMQVERRERAVAFGAASRNLVARQ